jgi:hypothetical protein
MGGEKWIEDEMERRNKKEENYTEIDERRVRISRQLSGYVSSDYVGIFLFFSLLLSIRRLHPSPRAS